MHILKESARKQRVAAAILIRTKWLKRDTAAKNELIRRRVMPKRLARDQLQRSLPLRTREILPRTRDELAREIKFARNGAKARLRVNARRGSNNLRRHRCIRTRERKRSMEQ